MRLRHFVLTLSICWSASGLYAISGTTEKKQPPHNAPRSAAECAPASGLTFLAFNNVNALIETGGSMWQDRPNHNAAYEIPAKSGIKSIYSGSLWMGGTDANDQLKIAAVTFRTGTNDFWTGPLSIGAAEITADVCAKYDRFYHITKQDVILFNAYWNCKNNGIGCDALPATYKVPKIIQDWPAHGDEAQGQDFYLAPFFDRDNNGLYDPDAGDYPYYDLNNTVNCRAVRDIRLFGDDTYWWVFNDKGNIHTETNGASIGMEIRAQAFAFATNDEVNNMTFYNYELINRSTFTLKNTYFGQWLDPDLGGANDDYVGCDVMRGLGYCYNGDDYDDDANGTNGYGNRPPAVGVDFFEGPYQDNDGVNNLYGIGANQALNGIGYRNTNLTPLLQDSIVDNERYGMRRFIYYNRGGGSRGDAATAVQHYNYLRSIWKDGQKMVFGGNGHPSDVGSLGIEADFMFPGDSDPQNWGTRGEDPGISWTEITAGNPPFDRRFLQSAGPFTLLPGAVNDITVGVVWARAISGSAEESVVKLVQADSKAQALFDNCFKVLDGPDAPDLSGVELDKEIILFLTNKKALSNNYKKYPGDYAEVDPFIIPPSGEIYDNVYKFQGYQIYQVNDNDVSINDLDNLDKARLAFQCDIKDSVADLVNFYFDEDLGATVPKSMVKNAANEGVKTTFRATEDLFAKDNPKLVNFRTYYYLAIAYAHNNYKEYKETAENLDGQKLSYLSSRKGTTGGVKAVSFTPHPQQPKNGGTILNAYYGAQPSITRIEGQGNGGNDLAFTSASLIKILKNSLSPKKNFPTYKAGWGPVNVKVIDPANVSNGNYVLKVYHNNELNDDGWKLWREGEVNDTVYSEAGLKVENEQLILKWGISVNMQNKLRPGEHILNGKLPEPSYTNGYISARMQFADSSKNWLTGVPDVIGASDQNWIRSGVVSEEEPDDSYNSFYVHYKFKDQADPTIPDTQYTAGCSQEDSLGNIECLPVDPNSNYEGLLGGTWAPFALSAFSLADGKVLNAPAPIFLDNLTLRKASIRNLQSVDIILTSDKNKWTRCPVIEMQENKALALNSSDLGGTATSPKGFLRQSPSVDKEGKEDGTGKGMGWFPGYAVNLETGERLNMAFGEDSWLGDQNGTDMIWNPTSTLEDGFIPNDPNRRKEKKWGGKHCIYVFGNTEYFHKPQIQMPSYDEGKKLHDILNEVGIVNAAYIWNTCLWVGIPLLAPGHKLLETEVTISLRVERPFEKYVADTLANNGDPMYEWNMSDLMTIKGDNEMAKDALNMIRVVPNPYYAFAEYYEQNKLDNAVKITNLPERCTVSIYNVSGTLVRKYDKSDPGTEIKWDIKNQNGVPIAGGLYLIHVDAPGIGEIIVKWFGVLRPVDLQGF